MFFPKAWPRHYRRLLGREHCYVNGRGRHWFAEVRGEDRLLIDGVAALPKQEGFDFSQVRQRMHRNWKPRGHTGYWKIDRPDAKGQCVLPDRFFGLF